jgi:hypothetical protein
MIDRPPHDRDAAPWMNEAVWWALLVPQLFLIFFAIFGSAEQDSDAADVGFEVVS